MDMAKAPINALAAAVRSGRRVLDEIPLGRRAAVEAYLEGNAGAAASEDTAEHDHLLPPEPKKTKAKGAKDGGEK